MSEEYVVFKYDKFRAEEKNDLHRQYFEEKNFDFLQEHYLQSILKSDSLKCSIRKYRKDLILRKRILLFSIATMGRHKIFCIDDKKGLVHFTFIIPYCKKFSFMCKQDYQIGPCWTREDYRGQGIYGKVVTYIAEQLMQKNSVSDIYMLIREMNKESINGINKTNFKRIGKCKKTTYLRYYKEVIRDNNNEENIND